MSQQTPNLDLTLYDNTGDKAVNFSTARAVWGGTGGNSNFEKIDTFLGTLQALVATLQAILEDGDKGDITVSGAGTLWSIDNGAVTLSKIVDATGQYKLMARSSAGSGDWQELSSSSNVFSILTAADYAAIRSLLGLVVGTNVQAYNANLTTYAGIAPSANVQSILGAANYAAIKTLLGLTVGTDVQAFNSNLTTYAGIAPSANVQAVLNADDYAAIRTLLGVGWISGSGTWSYTSADSPSFVASIPDADAALMGAGTRIKLTQTTTKYFIVTAKGSPSGGFTPVTMYGGTDYTLTNAAITNPAFSNEKSPLGFPMDKTKWRVTLTDTSDRSQASPTQGAWYNPTLSITIPIGQWRVYWEAALQVQVTTAASSLVAGFAGSLSTANNSESDNEFTARFTFTLPASTTNATGRAGCHAEKTLTLAAKTVYYLIASTGAAGIATLGFVGNLAPTKIVVECAYL